MADNKYVNNMSYTNKDFASIFRELLQIVPQVTSKWNPQNSNEADPGVVLLKLMAVIADKLNYNVDKNILETFPQSVTQMASARQLYSALGYSMKWYMSATTKISMKYNKGSNTTLPESVSVPKFTMVTNDDGTVVYTLLGEDVVKDTQFTNNNQIHSINAIEGVINSVEVNGSTTITLANLDSDFRIYLPNIYVAQNGIFITNQDQNNFDSWRRVDNLQSESLNQTVYKFGITDDQSGCYLEFPQDIANVIGSGLNIYYITSHGVHGNVSANNITRFYSDFTVQHDNSTINLTDSFFINNPSASTNGEDVESIDDAYRNYRKTIGTFDTLVTCRDYQNALYSLQNILSNVVVSDRSNDINHSVPIITFDGTTEKKVVTQPFDSTTKMTAFDLAIYALKPMSDAVNEKTFNDTFTPIFSDVFWQDEIASFKSVEHDYVDVSSVLTYIFENFFTLQGKVLTNYKVNKTEASDIENNIRLALWKSLNASKMIFGEQPEYSDLVDIIKNADTRIRDVVLDEPRYVLRRLKPADGGVVDIPSDPNDTTDEELLARLVLNGTVQLYQFDERYTPDYGQINPKLVENIQTISTEASIAVPKDTFYTLRKNEVVQALAPSYITTVTYTAYTDYEYTGADIEAGQTHTLAVDEALTVSYMDSDKKEITKTYQQGTTITPSIPLKSTSSKQSLGASATIEIKEKNTTTLAEGVYYCYWITNVREKNDNGEFQYVLFQENETQRLLDVNEYFIYADKDRTSLVILGSGTQLTRTAVGTNPLNKLTVKTKLSSEDINNLGLSAFQDSDWYVWEMSKVSLEITENDIYSFGEGTSIKMTTTPLQTEFEQKPGNETNFPAVSGQNVTQSDNWKAGRFRSGTFAAFDTTYTPSTTPVLMYVSGDSQGAEWTFGGCYLTPKDTSHKGYQMILGNAGSASTAVQYTYQGFEGKASLNLTVMAGAVNQAFVIAKNGTIIYPTESAGSQFNGQYQNTWKICENKETAYKVTLANIELKPGDKLIFAGALAQADSGYGFYGLNISIKVVQNGGILTNDFTPQVAPVSYLEPKQTEQTLPSVPDGYSVRSRLNLLASKTSPQELLSGQKVILQQVTPTGGSTPAAITIQGTIQENDSTPVYVPVYVQFSDTVYITGGEDVDVAVTDFDGKTGYTLACYYYTKAASLSELSMSDGNIDVYCKDMVGETNAKTIPFPYSRGKSFLVAILKSGSNSTITVGASNQDLTITSSASNTTVKNQGVYYFKATCADKDSSADIEVFSDVTSADSIRIYRPVPITGYGPQLINSEGVDIGQAVFGTLQSLDNGNLFNYTYKVPEEDLIEAENPISAAGFWDKNNPFNRCTIARLDTVNSSIVVAPSSKLK